MASLMEVETALAGLVAAACALAADPVVRCFPGFPAAAGLDADLRAGIVNVGVKAREGVGRAVPVSLAGEQVLRLGEPTLTAVVEERRVTFGGSVTPGWPVLLILDGVVHAYAPVAADTPESVAAALARLVAEVCPGVAAAGCVLDLPGTGVLAVRCVGAGTLALPLLRQLQGFCATIYAPTPALRDRVGLVARLALARSPRLALPDGTTGLLRVGGEADTDRGQAALAYERRLLVQVEYDSVEIRQAWRIGAIGGVLTAPGGSVRWGCTGAASAVLTDAAGAVLVDAGGDLVGTP
ncbi:conserved protein of unknown function [Rhodovastum atsumiense]|uniref:Uncharacterized protein n=1 Tax=Rhodovastum atsumiense TaxID=504468 RepID=A0A5M6IZR6_9PROT|nr:hypothetical protein [Rhodovastum atsumiense]KAA5613469.1 hypothetical protein F1189_05275 [Rhodovastum atsumiense]CAH2603206.1 conserved protein of unknown function [Rhodovastum atsumiense]